MSRLSCFLAATLILGLDPRQVEPQWTAEARWTGCPQFHDRPIAQSWRNDIWRKAIRCSASCIGAAVVGLGVLGYILYERQNRQVLKIDVPGFSGEISKDKGVDIEVDKTGGSASISSP